MLGVIIPCYSCQEDEEHVQAVVSQFSIPTKRVALDTVFDTLLEALPDEKAAPAVSRLAKGNLKCRLRMLTLYYFATD